MKNICPLPFTNDEQTLDILLLWENGHKMNAARKYSTLLENSPAMIEAETLTSYRAIHDYYISKFTSK